MRSLSNDKSIGYWKKWYEDTNSHEKPQQFKFSYNEDITEDKQIAKGLIVSDTSAVIETSTQYDFKPKDLIEIDGIDSYLNKVEIKRINKLAGNRFSNNKRYVLYIG